MLAITAGTDCGIFLVNCYPEARQVGYDQDDVLHHIS